MRGHTCVRSLSRRLIALGDQISVEVATADRDWLPAKEKPRCAYAGLSPCRADAARPFVASRSRRNSAESFPIVLAPTSSRRRVSPPAIRARALCFVTDLFI